MVQIKIRLTATTVNELQKYIFTGCNDMNRFVIYYMVIIFYLLQTYIYFIIMKNEDTKVLFVCTIRGGCQSML